MSCALASAGTSTTGPNTCGLRIIASGAWSSGVNGVALTQLAFDSGVPARLGGDIIALCLTLFAFSTILGWCYYGSISAAYLFGRRIVVPYRVAFAIAAYMGTVYSLDFVWLFSDVMNGLMAVPNLIGLLLLSGVTARETRKYLESGSLTGN